MSKQTYAVGEVVVPGYVVDIEEDDGPIHDQLPSVESVKVNTPSKLDKFITFLRRPDQKVSPNHVADIEGNEGRMHDQLPSVEEVKLSTPTAPARFPALYVVITCLLLVVGLVITTTSVKEHGADRTSDDSIENIVQFLRENNISDEPILRDPGSPQHEAVRFLAEGDAYRMELNDATAEQFVERYVLSLLYYAMKGTEWTYSLKFLSARNHCEWNSQFTTESGNILDEGVFCDDQGYVTKLSIGKALCIDTCFKQATLAENIV
jgi:hypothetical protein